jgi:FKBP-type peptidyl-prolyl cis-trans isomerase (trigger factor)
MNPKISSTVARGDDGNIQINFDIPYEVITKNKALVLTDITKNAEVAGFRKGKAPASEVEKKVSPEDLIEKTLAKILPEALGNAITENKLKPAIYPKFELIKADDDANWQIRAVTCELPQVEVGNYKKLITDNLKKVIITPQTKEKTQEEKEQEVIKLLIETIKIKMPKILIDEEVNSRLSQLLGRIEKLGLNLDSYLTSVGKTPQTVRDEYTIQAQNTISLELILQKIAEDQQIKVDEKQIDEVIKVSGADPKAAEKLNTPEQRLFIASILRKKAALESLTALV